MRAVDPRRDAKSIRTALEPEPFRIRGWAKTLRDPEA